MDTSTKILGIVGVVGVGYYTYNYLRPGGIKDLNELGSKNQDELIGYLNGTVRASGSYANAITQLDIWKGYWISEVPKLVDLIYEWYDYGIRQAKVVYGVY